MQIFLNNKFVYFYTYNMSASCSAVTNLGMWYGTLSTVYLANLLRDVRHDNQKIRKLLQCIL